MEAQIDKKKRIQKWIYFTETTTELIFINVLFKPVKHDQLLHLPHGYTWYFSNHVRWVYSYNSSYVILKKHHSRVKSSELKNNS